KSRWQGLDDKQRAAVISAYEKTMQEICDNWKVDPTMRPRLLQSEIKGDRASITLLRGDELSRLTLARRDGAWFITEHELIDEALPEFADALLGALEPAGRRRFVFEETFDAAMNHLEKLIAREGEKPELMLLKARVVETEELREAFEAHTMKNKAAADKDKETEKDKDNVEKREKDKAASVASLDIYKEVARRWPDFAPGRRALASELLPSIFEADGNQERPVKKDAGPVLAELQAYARLAPYDPRPWRDLAVVHEKSEKLEEAAADYEKAIELDRENLEIHKNLIDFQLNHGKPEKAKSSFARMLKAGADADEVFGNFRDTEDGYEPEYAASLENLLLSFPKVMEGSAVGWVLLSELQEAQKKTAAAIKSIQRSLQIEASAESYVYLSMLLRSERRYAESLDAADRGLKLEEDDVAAHFERVCALARLGRKDEAMAALKRMLEIDADTYFDPDEPDLEPLAELPEFQAIKEKVAKPGSPK
ncbi:MAG: tetratricopeptide repeat protein, partial [Blastocatellia bacterium]|nr:tetratricopeptide repeat protein [Blastocatellia bacterium]